MSALPNSAVGRGYSLTEYAVGTGQRHNGIFHDINNKKGESECSGSPFFTEKLIRSSRNDFRWIVRILGMCIRYTPQFQIKDVNRFHILVFQFNKKGV